MTVYRCEFCMRSSDMEYIMMENYIHKYIMEHSPELARSKTDKAKQKHNHCIYYFSINGGRMEACVVSAEIPGMFL